MAASFVSRHKPLSARTSTPRISRMLSHAGTSKWCDLESPIATCFPNRRCLYAILCTLTLRVWLRIASRPSDAAVVSRLCWSAVETGRDRMELHETRYPPRLSSRYGALCLRPHLRDSLDH